MGGWVVGKVEEDEAVQMRYRTSCMGGWVGGWVEQGSLVGDGEAGAETSGVGQKVFHLG